MFHALDRLQILTHMLFAGQWAPIAGTGLAALGSLYLLLAADVEALKKGENPGVPTQHCNCSHHHHSSESGDGLRITPADPPTSPPMQEIGHGLFTASTNQTVISIADTHRGSSTELDRTMTRPTRSDTHQTRQSTAADVGGRRKVANALLQFGKYFDNAARDWMDNSEFQRGQASHWPEVPGERNRNPEIFVTMEKYNPSHDGNSIHEPRRPRSRSASFTGSVTSGRAFDSRPATPRSSSPSPSLVSGRPHSNTLPAQRISFEPQGHASSSAAVPGEEAVVVKRRDTLEVPLSVHHNPMRSALDSPTSSTAPGIIVPRTQSSPAVITSDNDAPVVVQTPPLEVSCSPITSKPPSTPTASAPPTSE
jgi:hypothetical protein